MTKCRSAELPRGRGSAISTAMRVEELPPGLRPSIHVVDEQPDGGSASTPLRDLRRLRQLVASKAKECGAEDALAVSRTFGSLDMAITRLEEGIRLSELAAARAQADVSRLGALLAPHAGTAATTVDWRALESASEAVWADVFSSTQPPPVDPSTHSNDLIAIADEYMECADQQMSFALRLAVAAAVIAASAVALAVVAVARAFDRLNYYFVISGALSLTAALLWWQSSRARTAGREWQRVATGIRGIDSYLAPMSWPMQDLMRGAMVQRLFPRLLEDDDPIREPRWPDPNAMLTAISYGLAPPTRRQQPIEPASVDGLVGGDSESPDSGSPPDTPPA